MYAILGPDKSVYLVLSGPALRSRYDHRQFFFDVYGSYRPPPERRLPLLVEVTFKWRLLPSTPYQNGLAAWRRQISWETRLCFGFSKGGGWAPADNIIFGFVK